MKSADAWAIPGAAMAACLAMPGARDALESSMPLHMLLQIPALVLAGFMMAAGVPERARRFLRTCNAHGLSGWIYASLAMAFWMLPRALDESIAEESMAVAKFLVLITAGMAIRLSWRVSSPIVQLFFVGNWAWMSATAGLLYVESPQRLCNAYLASDQVVSGHGLLAQAVLIPLLWGYLHHRLREGCPAPAAAITAAGPCSTSDTLVSR